MRWVLVAVLLATIGFTALNYAQYHRNMLVIASAIRALDPTHEPRGEDAAALDRAMEQHMTAPGELQGFIGREAGLLLVAGCGVLLVLRRWPRA